MLSRAGRSIGFRVCRGVAPSKSCCAVRAAVCALGAPRLTRLCEKGRRIRYLRAQKTPVDADASLVILTAVSQRARTERTSLGTAAKPTPRVTLASSRTYYLGNGGLDVGDEYNSSLSCEDSKQNQTTNTALPARAPQQPFPFPSAFCCCVVCARIGAARNRPA